MSKVSGIRRVLGWTRNNRNNWSHSHRPSQYRAWMKSTINRAERRTTKQDLAQQTWDEVNAQALDDSDAFVLALYVGHAVAAESREEARSAWWEIEKADYGYLDDDFSDYFGDDFDDYFGDDFDDECRYRYRRNRELDRYYQTGVQDDRFPEKYSHDAAFVAWEKMYSWDYQSLVEFEVECFEHHQTHHYPEPELKPKSEFDTWLGDLTPWEDK